MGYISPVMKTSFAPVTHPGYSKGADGSSDPADPKGIMPFADKNAATPQDPKRSQSSAADEKDKSGKECLTCNNRKYQDGSDENVSFKSPTRVSPQAAGSAVRAHEQEHVSNAYSKAAKDDGKVISASVSIQTAICPECGRSYVSGGQTRTQIKYYNEENPYQQDLKNGDYLKYGGRKVDQAV